MPRRSPRGAPACRRRNSWAADENSLGSAGGRNPCRLQSGRREAGGAPAACRQERGHRRADEPAAWLHPYGERRAAPGSGAALQWPPGLGRRPHCQGVHASRRKSDVDRGARRRRGQGRAGARRAVGAGARQRSGRGPQGRAGFPPRAKKPRSHRGAASGGRCAGQGPAGRAGGRGARRVRARAYGGAAADVNQALVLRSPLSGVIVERQLNPGQELRPDASPPGGLFVVSDPSRLWFVLDVSEKDLNAVRLGAEVGLATGASGDERAYGRITHIADVVDPQTRTVKVRGTVKNSERRLKAEMFVTGEIRVPAGIGLLIPGKAVYLRGEQYFVFVEAGPGTFVRKAVRLGPATDGYSLVLEGISATDKVVTDGSLLLERVLASKD